MLEFNSTLWPEGIDPDNKEIVASSAWVVDCQEHVSPMSLLHAHPTGQLTIAAGGFVGVQYQKDLYAVPYHCGHWTPSGILHNGAMIKGAKSISFHFGKELGALFPPSPTTFLLNRMTFEMIVHFTNNRMTGKHNSHEKLIARVIAEEISMSKELPGQLIPLPENEKLRKFALYILEHPLSSTNCGTFAEELKVSERTLRRLVIQETGMNLRDWRMRLTMMRAIGDLAKGKTVQEAAFNCGFSSASAFTFAYKKYFGETPGKFRSSSIKSN